MPHPFLVCTVHPSDDFVMYKLSDAVDIHSQARQEVREMMNHCFIYEWDMPKVSEGYLECKYLQLVQQIHLF